MRFNANVIRPIWIEVRVLEGVLLIGRFNGAIPGSVELLQHLLRRRAAGLDDALERFEEAALVASEMIDPATPAQSGVRQDQTLLGDLEQIAVLDPRLEAETRHVIAQRLPLRRGPVPDDVPGGIEAVIVIAPWQAWSGKLRHRKPK